MGSPAGNLNVVTENARVARGGKDQTHQQLESGCFTSAVRAEKAEDLARID